MKKGLIRKVAFGIIAAMVISVVPYQYTMATDVGEIADEQIEEIPELTEETESASDEVISEEYNEESDKSIEAVDAAEQQSQDRPEQKLNYIYVEKPYLEIPDEQNIVISWGDGSDKITDLRLVYQKENLDEFQEIECSLNAGELFLFKKEFSKEDEKGIYNITSIKMTVDGVEAEYTLEELETEAVFGVNREYDGYKENSVQACTKEGEVLEMSVESSVEISTVSLDEDGNLSGEESIETALEEAEPDMAAEGRAAFFAMDANSNSRASARSDELVVAIDAGHDNIDAGAYYNGLREEVLTLKIAEYCKAELEKYAGVRVYMTRTDAGCPVGVTSSPHAGTCIDKRVKKAAEAGADVVVSIHLNASVASSAHGAEVIIPNKNWKPEQNKEGTELAKQILNQLTALGLYNRGFYWKDTTINEKYPDGSASDYFTIHNSGKEYGVTSMIVEHAFISNTGGLDHALLASEEGLKKLGVADATGIAKHYGLIKIGDRVSIPEGTYMLESALNNNKVAMVENNAVSDYARIVLQDKDNTSGQRFEIKSKGNGYYTIIAEHSWKAIDITDGSNKPGTPLQQFNINGHQAQEWAFVAAGNGYYYICSPLGTYIDVDNANTENGTRIKAFSFNQSNAQKWKLVPIENKPIENGTYIIENSASSNDVMSVELGSRENSANVLLQKNQQLTSQKWRIRYVKDGYYSIIAEHSGKSLDVENGSSVPGENLKQFTPKGNDAQLWKFIADGNGGYYIRSKIGTVINVDKSSHNSNINMMTMIASGEQRWKLTKSSYKPIEDGIYVIESAVNPAFVIDVANGSKVNGGNIQIFNKNNTPAQEFSIKSTENGSYTITSVWSEKALDVANGSSISGTNVQQFESNGTDAQQWKFIDAENGTYYIQSQLGTVLDIQNGTLNSGTNIGAYTLQDTRTQQWILRKKTNVLAELKYLDIKEGIYTIQTALDSNKVLDVANGSRDNGANIQIFSSNNTSAQKYIIRKRDNIYYEIISEKSGKALDVVNGSNANGTNVQLYDNSNVDAQLWRFAEAGNGEVYIVSKVGTVLDVTNGSTVDGTNVQVYRLDEVKAQKWILKETKSTMNFVDVKEGVYTIRTALNTNKVLDVANGSRDNGANIQIFDSNNTSAQRYIIRKKDAYYYEIISEKSGKALDVVNGSSVAGTNVQQYERSNVDAQLWRFADLGDGQFYIVSKVGTVLDVTNASTVNGANVQAYTLNESAAQKWMLKEVDDGLDYVDLEEGRYIIRTALDTNKVLDVESGSRSNGANIQIFESNNTEAQRYTIKKKDSIYYEIVSEKSGKALDVVNGSSAAGTNVQQYERSNVDAQLWRFADAGNGQYYIVSKLGTVLDVTNGSTVDGTNVQVYTPCGVQAQKWVLEKESLHKIMGDSSVTVDQMVKYYEAQRRDGKPLKYPYTEKDGAANITEFCQIYLEEAKIEGVKAEVAFAQAMKETGFLRFGGDVKKEQYNFAGIGAVGGGVQGAQFKDIRTGIRAQIQHLKAYASTDPLNQECVDPRFKYVKRGSAEYVEWLGQKENPVPGNGWAAGVNYGYSIVDDYIKPMMKH